LSRDGLGGPRLTELGSAAAAACGDNAPRAPLAGGLADGHRRLAGDLLLRGDAIGQDVALVDPDLHADASGRGLRLAKAVVDVRAQGVERHAPLPIGLLAGHLRAAEAPRALDADAEAAGLLHGLDRPLHGATERDPAGELVGDALSDEGRIE